MLTPLREAFYFSRNQFKPLFIIGLVYTIPSLFLTQSGMLISTIESGPNIIAIFVAMCLNLLPFGSAMIYIDRLAQGNPVSVPKAITIGLSKLGWMIVLNVLLASIIGVGFLLLIVPGVFFAYKLLFAELYLLLHNQSPMTALKSSYVATTGLFNEIVPPLLVWFGSTIVVSVVFNRFIGSSANTVTEVIYHGIMLLFTIYGWALMYRLYQRYLEAQVADPEDS